MVDWKVTPEIPDFSKYKQSGYGKCAHLADCKKSKYGIQQHAYKYLLENFYGPFEYRGHVYKKVKIVSMILLVMHDSLQDAFEVPIPEYESLVLELMDERRAKVRLQQHEQKGSCEADMQQ